MRSLQSRSSQQSVNMSGDCPICLETANDSITLVCCQHFFCRTCIEQWFQTAVTCPVCRQFAEESLNVVREFDSGYDSEDSSDDEYDLEPILVEGLPDYRDGFTFWVRGVSHELLVEITAEFSATVNFAPVADVPLIGTAKIEDLPHLRWTILAAYALNWMPRRWLNFYAQHAQERSCGFTYEQLVNIMNNGNCRVLVHQYPDRQPPFPLYICRRCINMPIVFSSRVDLSKHEENTHRLAYRLNIRRLLFC